MKCTELVLQDHAILRRGLDILDGMVKKLEDGDRIEIADVVSILKFLRLFGDQYHQSVEENFLFPALQCAAPLESPLSHMLAEHSDERSLVAAIENALKFKVGIDFVRSSRQLSILLRNHLDKEDTVFQRFADQALSPAEDNMIVAEFLRNYIQPESCMNFSRMERKYTLKPQASPISPAREIARVRGAVG
jgi:hemerythrin-like domain-containing protein